MSVQGPGPTSTSLHSLPSLHAKLSETRPHLPSSPPPFVVSLLPALCTCSPKISNDHLVANPCGHVWVITGAPTALDTVLLCLLCLLMAMMTPSSLCWSPASPSHSSCGHFFLFPLYTFPWVSHLIWWLSDHLYSDDSQINPWPELQTPMGKDISMASMTLLPLPLPLTTSCQSPSPFLLPQSTQSVHISYHYLCSSHHPLSYGFWVSCMCPSSSVFNLFLHGNHSDFSKIKIWSGHLSA